MNDTKHLDRLRSLLDPATTAVVTNELQRGIVGDAVMLPALADQVRATGMMANVGSMCVAARDAGVRVLHATVEQRPDSAAMIENCRIFALGGKAARAGNNPILIGSEGAKLMPELGDDPRDIVVARMHGMTAFTSTSLDQILRNLGITTIVACGVSVNMGVYGLILNAIDLGYQVVLPRDTVTGVPAEFAEAAIEHTLQLLATMTTAAEVSAIWAELAATN